MEMVLFDCNGTILDDAHIIYGFYRYAVDKWGSEPPLSIMDFFESIHDGDNYYEPYREAGVEINRGALNLAYKWYYRQRADRVDMHPSAFEVLESLRRRGIFIGLVTLQSRELVVPYFDDLNISKFFSDWRFESFDKTEDIASILSERNIDPGNACYVGDMPSDVKDGRRVGVSTFLFFNGCVNRSILKTVEREDEDIIINGLRGVLDRVQSF